LKNIEDLNIGLKRHKNFKERLQRKLITVSKERDFYKQLVENFDKDTTLSNASVADMTQDMQVRVRMEVLERTVTGYKDMCATLEREIQSLRQQEQTHTHMQSRSLRDTHTKRLMRATGLIGFSSGCGRECGASAAIRLARYTRQRLSYEKFT